MAVPDGPRQHDVVSADCSPGQFFQVAARVQSWSTHAMQEQQSTASSLTIIRVFCNPTLLILLPCCGSFLITTQAPLLEECPDKILVTAAQCVFSTAQSFVVAVVAERDFSRWKLNFDVSLLAIFYSVSFASSFCFFI